MADHSLPEFDWKDRDRWEEPDRAGFDDFWNDPADLRDREQRRLRRLRIGFAVLGFGLILACLFNIGMLVTFVLQLRPLFMMMQEWDFHFETAIVLFTLLGAGLLWGGSPDESWRRRSGLLLLMFLVDLVLWSVEHAVRLGLADLPFGHEPFRRALGSALGWAEFALVASIAAGMAATLGEIRALDLGRAVRSLTTVGAAVWVAFFFLRTDWQPPVWPLRNRPPTPELQLLALGSDFLSATILVQVTLLCLYAGRTCSRAARDLQVEEQASDSFLSRSETAWDEYRQADPDRHGR